MAGLDRLRKMGGNWIAVTPFAYQKNVNEPGIRFRPGWKDGLDEDVGNVAEGGEASTDDLDSPRWQMRRPVVSGGVADSAP